MKRETIHSRAVKIQKRSVEDREVYSASFSSEAPVKRYGYTEVLEHSADAINMERASRGLVLLFNHDMDAPIGRANDIALRNDGKLAGDFVFSDSDEGQRIKSMVDEGTLTDISIRYSIDAEKREESEDGEVTYTATRWTPMEVSVVSVPADSTVGIGRQHTEVETMKEKTPAGDTNTPDTSGVILNYDSARKAGESEGVLNERQRVADINALFAEPRYQAESYQALRDALIAEGVSFEKAMQRLLQHHGNETDDGYTPAHTPGTAIGASRAAAPTVRVTEAAEDKTIEALRHACDVKMQVATPEQVREFTTGNPFAGASFTDMARECLRLMGVENVMQFDAERAVGFALQPMALPHGSVRSFVGAGTSVFSALVESITDKQMQLGVEESGETYRQWVRIGRVSSFRQESRVDLSGFSDLDEIPENGEYKHGKMSDGKEYIQAKKYGKLFSVTREMLVNDDLDALSRIPREMGRAADRKIGDLVYALLTGNHVMDDGTALFASGHNNDRTSGGAPSVTELDAMKVLMTKQKDLGENSKSSNIRLAHLLVPIELETKANVLAMADHDPQSNAATSGDANTGGMNPNPFKNAFNVIADTRLSDDSTVKYYGAANSNQTDTVEVAFLNGQEAPYLESQNGFTVDGISYKVRREAGVDVINHRGLVRNAGA